MAIELAEAFVALRVRSEQVAKDVSKGLQEGTATGSKAAGEAAGTQFGTGFKAKAGPAFNKAVDGIAKAGVASLGIIGVASLKMAADFQEGLTTLVTGAGESQRNLARVADGIKGVATATGTTTSQLVAGMFQIESAGYHGAAGLDVLRAAAEGAKTGNADLGAVANAVTTVMTDYALKGSGAATKATDALIATVARGKTHLQDLASAMARVLPTASSLNVSMGQVGGAMATMTGEGTSARLAAMGLNATLLALASPTGAAQKAMEGLGLSSGQVATTLTKQGLVAALDQVAAAARRAGPEGSPDFVTAMKAMLGGTNGLRVGLQLTGSHMETLRANTEAVSKAMDEGKGSVEGWAETQKDFNVQLSILKARAEVAGITIGQILLPYASAAFKLFADNTTTLLIFTGVVVGLALAIKGVTTAINLWRDAQVIWAAVTSSSLIETMALWVMYTFTVESAALATVIATGGLVLVLAAVVAGVYLLYRNWGTVWGFIRRTAADVWQWMQETWAMLAAVLGPVFTAVAQFAAAAWQAIAAVATAVWNNVLQPIFRVLTVVARTAFLAISTAARIAWDIVSGVVLLAWAIIRPIITAYADLALALFRSVIAPAARIAWGIVSEAARLAWEVIRPILTLFGSVFSTVFHSSGDLAKTVFDAIKSVVQANLRLAGIAVMALWTVIETVFGFIIHGAADAFGWLPGLGPKLKDAAKAFDQFKDDVNKALQSIEGRHVTANVNFAYTQAGAGHAVGPGGAATGKYITAGTGPAADDVPIFVSRGEYIVQASAVSRYGRAFMDAVNAGRYATGGVVPGKPGPAGTGTVVEPSATPSAMINAMVNKAVTDLAAAWAAGMGGMAIATYARQFLGQIPYVWGGTAVPGGADCSGFTQAVYAHFGISAPRTSEAQGGWVRRTGPVPGGLAFYVSPAGGAPPGHVAIVQDANTVISQGGGMGPTLERLNFMPLMWTGIPPGGFPGGNQTLGGNGGVNSVRGWLLASMNTTGAPLSWFPFLEWMVGAESGGNPRAYNPNGGASGLLQMKPATYAAYATLAGGIWDPVANSAAAERYIAAVYGAPWNIPGVETSGYKGYAAGGRIPEDVLGIGASGSRYLFHGGEQVSPADEAALVDTGLERHLEVIAGLLASAPDDIGAALGDVLNGLGRAAMRNRSYPAAGVYG